MAKTDRERWVFTYSVEGDLRFISHRDTLRMFQRALARASCVSEALGSDGKSNTLRLREGLVLSFAMLLNAECAVMRSIRAFADSDSASAIGARGRWMCLGLT